MYLSIKSYSKESFIKFYNELLGKKKFNNKEIIFDVIKYKGIKVTFYSNLTILFNGKISKELEEKIDIIIDKELYVGSDEVGVGESIGPIVAVALKFKSYKDKKTVIMNGIKDSKKLSASEIFQKANFIKNHVEYYSIIITPKKFNTIYKKLPNVKAINALMQNQLHKKFEKKNYKHITDQFVNEKKYKEYIKNSKNESFKGKLLLVTKAEEKYLEVSGAAIIAKDIFNKWIINELQNEGITLNIKNKLNSWEIFQNIKKGNFIIKDKNHYIKNWNKNE